MLTKPRYTVKDLVFWTRTHTLMFAVLATVVTAAHVVFEYTFLKLPWTPLALLGTAVAFVVGFQNNAAYGRIWEARKIWGGIVNSSRTWAMQVLTVVNNEHAVEPLSEEELIGHRKRLIHRHLAWLTSLRFAMRLPKPWEQYSKEVTNREWSERSCTPERHDSLDTALSTYLTSEEQAVVSGMRNTSSAILLLQSQDLASLKQAGLIWEFSFIELQSLVQECTALQGKSERIKNFPYPRQYATLSYYFVNLFILLLPFGLVPEFYELGLTMQATHPWLGKGFCWFAVPFCTFISWVFYTMERIGRVGENPFEGSPNDVPISTISRGIEIELRQMLRESADTIPQAIPELNNVQM